MSRDPSPKSALTLVKKFLLWLISGIVIIALLVGLGIAIMGWDSIWEKTAGKADLGPVTFATLTKTPKPNQALICPDNFCKAAQEKNQIDRKSPIYLMPADELKSRLLETLQQEKDLTRVDDETDNTKLRFVQRTATLRFPDTIRIEIVALENNRSTLALYSQSQIGYSDNGVNRKRLERWLKRLAQFEA